MASGVYTNATLLLSNPVSGPVAWASDTIKMLLVTSSYTFNLAHVHVSDVVADEVAGSPYSRQTLGSKTQSLDTGNNQTEYSSATVVFASLNGCTPAGAVIFKDLGTGDSTAELLGFCAFTPVAASGVNYNIVPSATGWFALQA